MSSIKLTADSGGGTFEIKAPSSGSNARVLTIPDSASGTVLTTTNPKAGNIIQVVHVDQQTAVESTSTSTYVNTGLSTSITLTDSSNKILVMISQNFRLASASNGGQNGGAFQILRGSTNITPNQQAYLFYNSNGQTASLFNYLNYAHQVLDTPGSGTHTYSTKMISYGSGTSIYANYAGNSRTTLLEVAV